MSTAIIAGGGIAGLATAIALRQHGWDVEVLERAERVTEVGAGISLWGNAMTALRALGLADAISAQASLGGAAGIRDDRGRWLSSVSDDTVAERFGPTVVAHRADLLETLRGALPSTAIRTGVTVSSVDTESGVVTHSAGTSAGDLVVGADGLWSAVRQWVVGDDRPMPRFSGYSAWRAVTEPVEVRGAGESWGRGERFGLAPLADGRVYWFAVSNSLEGATPGGLDEIRRRFGHWHDPIPTLIAATTENAVLHHDIYDLPPLQTYARERAALVGDAAHAMTPNLGQGAGTSLEDAVELARTLERGGTLTTYDALRRPRTQAIARRARGIGLVAQCESALLVPIRNAVLRATPDFSVVNSLRPVLEWS